MSVAYLAHRCALTRKLDHKDVVHLTLSGLLHDVATPPFGHTLEYVLPGFDHELESQKLLHAIPGTDFVPDVPVFASQLPRFRAACKSLASELGVSIDPDRIADAVVGRGELGFLIHGTLDLDNADNVTRACHYLGIDVDGKVPVRVADWLANQDAMPSNLGECSHEAVRKWHGYREQLYSAFYNSSDGELARQGFLQHIFRRAVAGQFPRAQLVWNTDERLLYDIERFDWSKEPGSWAITIKELIQRYALLEQPMKVAQIELDPGELDALKHPEAGAWIEEQLSSRHAELFVLISSRRYAEARTYLFPPPAGVLLIFKLGSPLKKGHLPSFIQHEILDEGSGSWLVSAFSTRLRSHVSTWCKTKPWLNLTRTRESRIVDSLDFIGDWGFRLSQNDNLHPYPGTFVHAIPASLITALGLKGELILDPFGGTGQTAVESIKYGGRAISADVNSIACLAARTKITFLPNKDRLSLRGITCEELRQYQPCKPPVVDNLDKWFHSRTLDELCKIWRFITCQRRKEKKQFLTACFSAMLPSCTARRGKQHGWFADNTPLPRGQKEPEYQDALSEFVLRVDRNLTAIEELYAYLERDNRDPVTELSRVHVIQVDASCATPADYGVEPGTVAGIITSPPYLCMADYTLGQRLSYYWIYPEAFNVDFAKEIGARRLRLHKGDPLQDYLNSMKSFAKNMADVLRPGGFLCTVLGAPVAKAFEGADIIKAYDVLLAEFGFDILWKRERNIHWHRNYGYAKLKKERISVHVFR
ncbi:MAG: HD domain-containing protein [Sedimentisphaerales bacterium]|nr:HD domain-containing protein [Sedimentisphaerales bacterium]